MQNQSDKQSEVKVEKEHYRIFRQPNNRQLFAVCRTDKYDNPLEIILEGAEFEVASKKMNQLNGVEV